MPVHDSSGSLGERLFALAICGFGLCFALGTYLLPAAPGYSQVGPGVLPAVVAVGLLLVGGALLRHAFVNEGRDLPEADRGPFDRRCAGYVCLGLLAHAALIGFVGFVAAATVLFVLVARAFGSLRWARDGLIALILSAALYWLFTQVLKLSLGPALGALGTWF